jgi:hypothetical protein
LGSDLLRDRLPRGWWYTERGVYAHQGDSEFIIIEAKPGNFSTDPGQYWELAYITLSAHWQAPTDETARYSYDRLRFPGTDRGRPEVWVAEDKHANYRSQSVCDAGAMYADNCDNPLSYHLTLDVFPAANVGNSNFSGGYHLIDCVESRKGFAGRECFWEPVNFHGWLSPRQGGGAGPYGTSLTHFGF